MIGLEQHQGHVRAVLINNACRSPIREGQVILQGGNLTGKGTCTGTFDATGAAVFDVVGEYAIAAAKTR